MASLSSWALRGGGESPDYLCFTAEEEGSTVKLQKSGSPTDVSLQIYIDGTSWSDYVFGTEIFLAHAGDKVYFRNAADEVTGFSTKDGQYQFSLTGKISASGNVMSLVDKTCTATTIPNDYCFSGLFLYCESLIAAPELPAITVAEECYTNMFNGCTNLTTAPTLPATTLAQYCYYFMFHGCSALTTAPELPATTLAEYCYQRMFSSCTALTTAPELPATTLANSCYQNMFSSCTNLTTAPTLPATTLAEYCYQNMFASCTNLNYIKVGFTNWGNSGETRNWFYNAPSTGTFVCPEGLSKENTGVSGIPEGWTVLRDYLCFTAEEEGSTVELQKSGSPTEVSLQISIEGTSWSDYVFGTAIFLAHAGDKVYFRNKSESVTAFSASYNRYQFSMTGKISASGNVMSLVDKTCTATAIPNDNCFSYLFSDCTALTAAPELPATTLASNCYESMFSGCTNLTTAPTLPATTLASSCYTDMFYKCENLTTAPTLPATTLAEGCYYSMFSCCSAMTTAPTLPATTLAGNCYLYMFSGCKSLTTVPTLPAITLANNCYTGMFDSCTALTIAPDLPATTLAYNCYSYMFKGCTNLNTAPDLPATTLASSCYSYMFKGCTNLNTAPDLPATTLAEGCYSGMFSGCTNLTTSLEISSVGWASLYENLPLKVPEGVEVYYASAISGSTITFTQIPEGTVMAPGTAVIVKGTGTVLFPVSGEEGTSFPTNYLTGTTVSKAYDKDTDPVVYTLSGVNSEGKLQFSKYTGTTLGAHKAYLPASALPSGSEAKDFTFVFDDGTSTGIPTVPALSPAHGKRYNLNGVPVDEHYKGLIIKNGKKMWSK